MTALAALTAALADRYRLERELGPGTELAAEVPAKWRPKYRRKYRPKCRVFADPKSDGAQT